MPTKKIEKSKTPKGKGKATAAATPATTPAPNGKLRATEAIKGLQLLMLEEETIAHRVAAIMTGKKCLPEYASNEAAHKIAASMARRFGDLPHDLSKIVDQETSSYLAVITEVVHEVGVAAFMKLIPTHRGALLLRA